MPAVTYEDVGAAARRITGVVRPVTVTPADPALFGGGTVHLALEFMQHTGSFKARCGANLVAALLEDGRMPKAGIVMATGANADFGYAWAGRRYDVPVTVFAPLTAPPARVAGLRALGAEVRLAGDGHTEAMAAARAYAEETGALDAYPHDEVLGPAGSGTLLAEVAAAVPGLDTVIVAVGAGGMFAGVTAAADHHGVRVVAAEPYGCRALNAALAAGAVVEVPVDSVAADSLGALRVSQAALDWARTADVRCVLTGDPEIIRARRLLWEHYRLVVEHGSATTLAALTSRAYVPRPGESVAVILCGANTDPADLV